MNMNRGFNEILADVDGGRLLQALSQKLAEVVNASKLTGKLGALKLELKIKPDKSNQVVVSSDIKAIVPEDGVATAMFFADEHGNLTRNDPNQTQMFPKIREIA